jgi:hypothetical protein
MKCKCGEGYASEIDTLCRFCREHLLSRAEAKKVGVKHRGDGCTLDQYSRAKMKYK